MLFEDDLREEFYGRSLESEVLGLEDDTQKWPDDYEDETEEVT